MIRKFARAVAMATAGVALWSGVAAADPAPAEVRLGWASVPRVWVLGKIDGTFDKVFGAPVKWVQFASGADVLNLLAAKEVDIVRFGSSPAVSGYVQGLPIELISVPEVVATSEQLVVRDPIKDVKDLAGKTIAYPPNSTAQYALEALLDLGTIDRSKVKLVPLKPAEIVAAWKRGDIDGAYAWDPAKAELVADGAKVIFSTSDLRKDGVLIYNNFVVSKDFAQKHPDLLAKFLKAYEEKVEEYKRDPEAAVQKIAKYLDQPVDSVRNTLAGLDYPTIAELLTAEYLGDPQNGVPSGIAKAQKATADFLVKVGQLQKSKVPDDFTSFNNNSFLKQAQQ